MQLFNPIMPGGIQIIPIPGQPGLFPPGPMPSFCPVGTIPYTVRPGDTLFSIAQRFGTTVQAIIAVNPGINPNLLLPGQVICVPQQNFCPIGSFSYTIRPGDTLFSLAARFNTTVQAILAINPGLNPNNLQVGQVICIPQGIPTPPPPTTCPLGSFAYTVNPGDTIFRIAQQFGTTPQAIIAINPGINPNALNIGQVICVPRPIPTPPPACPFGSFSYTVRPGDTLFTIAQRFGTTVQAILAINPGIDPNNLQIGQVICVPQPIACPIGSFAYTIRPGDTLIALAQRFNTTVAAILAINPGLDPNSLQIGQVICIPQVTPTTRPPVCPPGSFAYTVRAGDTLFTIAQRFGTTVQAILAINPGIDPNALQIGQVICVPQPITCPIGSFEYTIRAGDTLIALAARFNTTVAAILALNPGLDPNSLQIGQVICIPQAIPTTQPPGVCPVGSFAYTIRPGDTLFALALRYNTTVGAILALNPFLDPQNLVIGQVICIPQTAPLTCPPGSFAYTIAPGDTLLNIAQRYNTTVAAILALNPGVDPNALIPGQRICVPERAPITCPIGSFAYTIRPGDTLFALAQRYNTRVEDIIAGNPGLNPNNLVVGQVICIPLTSPTSCPLGSFPYTIQPGDTLAEIARRFNTNVGAILQINPGLTPNNLQIGQTICIPAVPTPFTRDGEKKEEKKKK